MRARKPADGVAADAKPARTLERRHMLAGLGALGAGLAGMAGVGGAISAGSDARRDGVSTVSARDDIVAFYGEHQADIATPAQDRLALAAFDVTDGARRSDLIALLRDWTAAATAMTAGRPVPGGSAVPAAPPADTGEAGGLPPASLTLTAGFGPRLFDRRFGLASRRPDALAPLPALPGDELEPNRSGGDLAVQACADDPQVAFHAARNLARVGRGIVTMRWFQLGFGRTSSTSTAQSTPRNLMGFKDGTRNIKGEDTSALEAHVWVGRESEQAWMRGGSYLVIRRIRMLIESWDRGTLADQEAVFGRTKDVGAPLTGRTEFDVPDFRAVRDGEPVVADDAHVRLASPENNGGLRILRRGYSYTDGIDPATGQLDAGLVFLAYQKDPQTQFVPLQRRLGRADALNEYIRHTGSGLFACPPGVAAAGDWWGRALFT
ncbi:MAG: iron uptake transporter deferrochelatase/peroxidase subunit [Frankiaceae bacterium]